MRHQFQVLNGADHSQFLFVPRMLWLVLKLAWSVEASLLQFVNHFVAKKFAVHNSHFLFLRIIIISKILGIKFLKQFVICHNLTLFYFNHIFLSLLVFRSIIELLRLIDCLLWLLLLLPLHFFILRYHVRSSTMLVISFFANIEFITFPLDRKLILFWISRWDYLPIKKIICYDQF